MIIVDRLITNKANFTKGRPGKITYIVLHTAGGGGDSVYDWFQTNTARVSAHYFVRKDGKVERYVKETDTAHHAGDLHVNYVSIGIEFQDDNNWRNPKTYTLKQYNAGIQLVAEICYRYKISVDLQHIAPHNRYVKGRECPGTLDRVKIIKMAKVQVDIMQKLELENKNLTQDLKKTSQSLAAANNAKAELSEELAETKGLNEKLTADLKLKEGKIEALDLTNSELRQDILEVNIELTKKDREIEKLKSGVVQEKPISLIYEILIKIWQKLTRKN